MDLVVGFGLQSPKLQGEKNTQSAKRSAAVGAGLDQKDGKETESACTATAPEMWKHASPSLIH